MGYVSDWDEAAKQASDALAWAASVGCDSTPECPGTDHLLTCRRFRRERREAKGA